MAHVEHMPPNDPPDLEDSEDSTCEFRDTVGAQPCSFFLKMQTILHILESSIQDIIQSTVCTDM